MAELKVLATTRNEADKKLIGNLKCKLLAEYPDCVRLLCRWVIGRSSDPESYPLR